jgi:hypothetical protein
MLLKTNEVVLLGTIGVNTKLKTPILKYKYKTIENTNTPIENTNTPIGNYRGQNKVKLKISVNYRGQYKAKLTLTTSTKLKTLILKYKGIHRN